MSDYIMYARCNLQNVYVFIVKKQKNNENTYGLF